MPNDKHTASAGRSEYSAPQQAGRDNSLQSATAVAPLERQGAACDTLAAGGGQTSVFDIGLKWSGKMDHRDFPDTDECLIRGAVERRHG